MAGLQSFNEFIIAINANYYYNLADFFILEFLF